MMARPVSAVSCLLSSALATDTLPTRPPVSGAVLLPTAAEDQPKAPSEVDPERWLDVSMASPPPPDWRASLTPGLSVVVPSFARPDNLHVQLFYLLRLPVMQHPSSEVLIAHGSRVSYDHRNLIDGAVEQACGPSADAADILD